MYKTQDLLHEDGIEDLEGPVAALQQLGTIRETDVPPFTFQTDHPTPGLLERMFVPISFTIVMEVEDYLNESNPNIYLNWNQRIREMLDNHGPMTASVSWFDSYKEQLELNFALFFREAENPAQVFILKSRH
ncbi:unnamed protein product [Microthlaspi erraticum]|uniref:Uncharacterized protein n=1 Tax=Microthlaspi erraticum TaxID=1685480 RepID=A0A6D2L5X5_9BRAS|nr:unnamed protein product [Microthlaspi erraticum]